MRQEMIKTLRYIMLGNAEFLFERSRAGRLSKRARTATDPNRPVWWRRGSVVLGDRTAATLVSTVNNGMRDAAERLCLT